MIGHSSQFLCSWPTTNVEQNLRSGHSSCCLERVLRWVENILFDKHFKHILNPADIARVNFKSKTDTFCRNTQESFYRPFQRLPHIIKPNFIK